MKKIVEPKIEQEEAKERLAKNLRPLGRKRDIIKSEMIYLPSYVFNVSVETARSNKREIVICLDAILGEFAFFNDLPLHDLEEINFKTIDFLIQPSEATDKGKEHIRRFLLQQSLKQKYRAELQNINLDNEIYYPFWIGYFYRKGALDFDVIDGVSGEKQGVTMRPVFIKFLMELNNKVQ